MGTNYYLHEKIACPTCGHAEDPIHIGKSSAGWCFSLAVYEDVGLRNLDDWIARWGKAGTKILDEYGREVTPGEMLEIITGRSWGGLALSASELTFNHAESGPNGLMRHRIGDHCVAHGPGTWDLIRPGFS